MNGGQPRKSSRYGCKVSMCTIKQDKPRIPVLLNHHHRGQRRIVDYCRQDTAQPVIV
jgi:hypothetical protein